MKVFCRVLVFVLFLGMCGSVFAVGGVEDSLKAISGYEYGKSRMPLTELENMVKGYVGSPRELREIEVAMSNFLLTDATDASKQFVCRQIGLIGTGASAGILGQMLVKDETNDMARYALERIPGKIIDGVLLDGLGKTKGKAKIGIINSIGVRRMNFAVGALSKLASDGDKDTVAAAINSLGQIGSKDAAKALDGISKGGDEFRVLAEDSYIRCADQLAADGKKKDAIKIYKKVGRKSGDAMIRVAAFRGQVRASRDPSGLIVSTIDSKDLALQVQAISLASMIKGSSNIKKAAGKISKLSVSGQMQLLFALADTGDAVILPVVLESIKSSELEVRVAAIKALKSVGNPASVGVLAEIAANTKGEEQDAARGSLYGMSGKGVDEAILRLLDKVDSKVATELVTAVDQRRIGGAVDALAVLTASKDAGLSREAYRAIAEVGTAKDVDKAIDLLVGLENEGSRVEAETTVVVLCRRTGMSAGVKKVVAALDLAGDSQSRLSLYTVLGKTGSDGALSALRKALKDPDDDEKTVAIRALSQWPEGSAAEDLLAVVKGSNNRVHKVLALRGFIKLVPLGDKKASEKVELLKEAMGLCSNVNEKRMVISSLSAVDSIEALQLCKEYIDDPSIGEEAAAAVLGMGKTKGKL
ncbi:MAG: hypothetical protein FVQ79_11345 [Planctomycetes bacterium]|nr:hypothetical protein [Planctomycetota bacterium]